MELVTTADVAAELRCTPRTVARLVKAGLLAPTIQAPGPRGAFLFDPEAVRALAESRGKA